MGVRKYTKEVIKEGKRVRWPKSHELWPAFVTVLAIAIFAALILMLEDLAAGSLINTVNNVFKGWIK